MHKITGDREAVLRLLNGTIRQIGDDNPKSRKAGLASLSLRSEARWPENRDKLIDSLKRGYDRARDREVMAAVTAVARNRRAVDSWYAPRDRTLAIFQAAMDEYLDESASKKTSAAMRAKSGKAARKRQPEAKFEAFLAKTPPSQRSKKTARSAALEQFDNLDPRWIEVVWEKAKLLFKGKRKFIKHTSVTDFRFSLAEKARIAVVGDWGGGNAAAQAVARQIQKLDPLPDHLIHLGDVYYAGTPKEVQDRFFAFWPTPNASGSSFALNSNHEMYSGGYGYFDTTLKKFKQPASYFSLGNKNWRFIGLDTGYVDHDLNREQVAWLKAQLNVGGARNVLLTHHQLFSAYEDTNADNLLSRVQPFLAAKQIYGWIWGHEHLCVVYKENMGVKARCVGNGCFPYNPPTVQPRVPVEWIDDRPQPNVKDYKGIHTFALLDIEAETVKISYVDQDGQVGFEETWP